MVENPIIHEQGSNTGKNAMVIRGLEHIGKASDILNIHKFSPTLALQLVNQNLNGVTIKQGPEKKTWPEDVLNPIEHYEFRELGTNSGNMEYSLCHFRAIHTPTNERGWRTLDLGARLATEKNSTSPIEIIYVTKGKGSIVFLDDIDMKDDIIRGSKIGTMIDLEPGMFVVVTSGIGYAISSVDEKSGLDFVYISRPPYDAVKTEKVVPQETIV